MKKGIRVLGHNKVSMLQLKEIKSMLQMLKHNNFYLYLTIALIYFSTLAA